MQIINHVSYVLDVSGSMYRHLASASTVLKQAIEKMKTTSASAGQQTYISLYTFNDRVNCLFQDRKIEDVDLNSISFVASGQTALIDATLQPILDAARVKLDRKGLENHAYLIAVITDGEENHSKNKISDLQRVINKLSDEWTLAIQVPNISSVAYAKMCGFPAGNIEVWAANSVGGLEESTKNFASSFDHYVATRSLGTKSVSNFYKPDTSNLTSQALRQNLTEIPGTIYHAQAEYEIRDFVEKYAKQGYVKGSAFYELLKPEIVQEGKDIVVVHKSSGKKYSGANARSLLNIPAGRIKLSPSISNDYRVFVQSTSVNRKIPKGTSVFVKD